MTSASPDLTTITTRQNDEPNIRRRLASGFFYRRAKWINFGGTTVAVLLAAASPPVLLYAPDLGPTLGAAGGGWIFFSRIALEPLRRKFQLDGVLAQEAFDCDVFGLGWNDSLGHALTDEEIRKASKDARREADVRDWYTPGITLSWPSSVLVCQRCNAVWARRQHSAYGMLLYVLAAAWSVIGVVTAVAHGATLAEYLTTVALPSAPALLDAVEMGKQHRGAAAGRRLLEHRANAQLRVPAADTAQANMRKVQDQMFALRRDSALVPDWFYKLIKTDYEQDMLYAVQQAALAQP